MDQLLLATYAHDLRPYRRHAEQLQCGLELHAFTEPGILANNPSELLQRYKKQLAGFSGRLGMHGAFYDMVSASIDPDVQALTRTRYRQCLQIAAELEVEYLIFHANYMGAMGLADYWSGWHKRQVSFWVDFMHEAEQLGMMILLENMWADHPQIINDVLAEVNSPRLRVCLDLSHAALYSPTSLSEWITALYPYMHCCHLNNHDGRQDLHWPLGKGVIDYKQVLTIIRQLPHPPLLTLELPNWNSICQSLPFLHLNSSVGRE